MTIIEDELSELRRCCENVIPDSKVIACVPAMIRVEIRYDIGPVTVHIAVYKLLSYVPFKKRKIL